MPGNGGGHYRGMSASFRMNSLPTEPERAAATAAVAAPSPGAQAAMKAFAAFLQEELRQTLAAGQPYSTLMDGQVVWMHPDGVLRLGMEPTSPAYHQA